jgi:parallel beta-helix repeat protein
MRFVTRRALSAAGAVSIVVGGSIAFAGPALASPASWHQTIYASPNAKSQSSGRSCYRAKYSTISAAVAAASSGDTVVACAGTYTEDVVIPIPLTLVGKHATINAAGLPGAPTGAVLGQQPYNGITIESSHVTVRGFTVENAEGEGILAVNPDPVTGPAVAGRQLYTGQPLTKVTIEDNVVKDNDVGFGNASSPYIPCTPNGGSDCGEGIHLLSVADSVVKDNRSVDNAGGILLTDEYGPTHDNLIQGNYVVGNTKDCGITLPGHNLALNPATGLPDPSFGGVYRNRVIGNYVSGNGVKGYGAGVGVFAPESYTGSYDNYIAGNYIVGNGLAGISVHSHAPNAYVNGNVFVGNRIGTNNVDLADGTDTTPISTETTGILIWSDATTYHFVVAHNVIFNNGYGIWLTPSTVQAAGLKTNHFIHVGTPVFQAS